MMPLGGMSWVIVHRLTRAVRSTTVTMKKSPVP
jgi:hypothetical protein